jgi:hypothetical protein
MKTLREAAQQALEALDWIGCSPEGYDQMCDDRDRAQAALRAALAQPEPRNQCGETCERAKLCAVCAKGLAQQEQEPIKHKLTEWGFCGACGHDKIPGESCARSDCPEKPVTHPPRREWQGLTEEDMEDLLPLYSDPSANTEMLEFAAAVEATLKEKNHG